MTVEPYTTFTLNAIINTPKHKMHSLLKLHLLIFKAGIVISTTNCLINCLILRKIKVVLKLTNKMNKQRNENKDVYMQ